MQELSRKGQLSAEDWRQRTWWRGPKAILRVTQRPVTSDCGVSLCLALLCPITLLNKRIKAYFMFRNKSKGIRQPTLPSDSWCMQPLQRSDHWACICLQWVCMQKNCLHSYSCFLLLQNYSCTSRSNGGMGAGCCAPPPHRTTEAASALPLK